MNDRESCRVCGEKRPADAPAGLCPACLLKAGLAAKDSRLQDVTILFGPASSSVVAAFGEAFGKIPPVGLISERSVPTALLLAPTPRLALCLPCRSLAAANEDAQSRQADPRPAQHRAGSGLNHA